MNTSGIKIYVNGVYSPILDALGDLTQIEIAFIDRYSTDEEGGLDSQVARHMAFYPDDPEVQKYKMLIALGVFNQVPKGTTGSVLEEGTPAWLCQHDVHDKALPSRPQICMVRFGNKLFVRVNMSAIARDIRRMDGSEENVYTVLLLSLLKACPNLGEVRWAQDVTRASRNGVNWNLLLREHQERKILMSFGGQVYDPTDPTARMMLSILGAVGAEDDPTRRRRLLSGQITKWQAGAWALGIQFLPQGWDLERRQSGIVAPGTRPHPNLQAGQAMGEVFQLYADGKTPRELVTKLAQLEFEKRITRRGGNQISLTFQDCLDSEDPHACYKVVARLLRGDGNMTIPSATRPSEFQLSQYLAGADPAEVFDIPQRLTIAKIELFRTGIFLRSLKSTIRQAGLVINGVSAVTFNGDPRNSFFIIPVTWSWPTNPETGETIDRFGIPDDVLRRSAIRLLRALSKEQQEPMGGRAHDRLERRAFQNFNEWEIGEFKYNAWAAVGSRKTLVNTTIYRQEINEIRPWSHVKNDPLHKASATIRQRDLIKEVARNIKEDIPSELLSVTQTYKSIHIAESEDEAEVMRNGYIARSKDAFTKAKESRDLAAGSRKLAAMNAQSGDDEIADMYTQDSKKHLRDALEYETRARQFKEQAEQEVKGLAPNSEIQLEADLSIAAYLAVALTRAAESQRVSPRVGELCDRLFSNWTFEPIINPNGEQRVRYTVDFDLPVEGETKVQIALTGEVPNVYKPSRKK